MDSKQKGMLAIVGMLGLMMFLVSGMATGAISARRIEEEDAATANIRPEFDPNFLYNRALQYYERGDREMAREIARRVTYLKPKYIFAYNLLAAIALREHDWPEAIKECGTMLEIDPTSNTARLALASAYHGSGDPKKAEALYRQIIADERSTDREREEAHLQLSNFSTHHTGEPIPEKMAR